MSDDPNTSLTEEQIAALHLLVQTGKDVRMNEIPYDDSLAPLTNWIRAQTPRSVKVQPTGFYLHSDKPLVDVVIDNTTYHLVGKCVGQRPGEVTLINPKNGRLATIPKRWLPKETR